MISYLEGIIKHKSTNSLIILTGGVGYKVFLSSAILTKATTGNQFSIFTYTNVREDAIELYGFETPEDLTLFEMFLTVSGIGPKTALNIFSMGKTGRIREAIIKGDVNFFSAVPRMGKKNAQKIIIELRSKMGSLEDLDLSAESGDTGEIIEALRSFGFSPLESKDALKYLRDVEGDTSVKIKAALKFLGGRGKG